MSYNSTITFSHGSKKKWIYWRWESFRKSSLIHLLDRHDRDYISETQVLEHSPFYSEELFKNILKSKNGLCILDMNIANVFNPISVICLNECWLNEVRDGSMLNLPGYKLFNQIGKCPGHSHCGLIIFVHEQFICHSVNLKQNTSGWEYLCVEVSHHSQNSKKHLICNIYRPPDNNVDMIDLFIEQFSSLISLVKRFKRSILLCGDFNINLLELNTNKHFNTYFECIISKGFFPKITLPTRIQWQWQWNSLFWYK